MAAEAQYVVVTRYVPDDGKPEIVHVYGSWSTRARADTVVRQMVTREREDGPSPCGVSYYIRKVLVDPS